MYLPHDTWLEMMMAKSTQFCNRNYATTRRPRKRPIPLICSIKIYISLDLFSGYGHGQAHKKWIGTKKNRLSPKCQQTDWIKMREIDDFSLTKCIRTLKLSTAKKKLRRESTVHFLANHKSRTTCEKRKLREEWSQLVVVTRWFLFFGSQSMYTLDNKNSNHKNTTGRDICSKREVCLCVWI